MSKKIKKLLKIKKTPIIIGGILAVFIAVFLIGLITTSLSGGSAIKIVSAQSVFQPDETPQFIFVYKNQTNIFVRIYNSIANLFSSENKEFSATVKILNANGEEVNGLDPQIKKESSGKFSVDLDHSRFQQELRPGQYEMVMEIIDNGKTYTQKQDFYWGVLAINTNKSIYLPNEEVYLQIASLKDDGHTICDSMLWLEIITPKGKKINPEIQKSGKCGADNVVDVPDYFAHYQVGEAGKYQMTLTNLGNNYSITDYFEVRDSIEFDIERTGPTRIFPQADYEMKIRIKANQDFEGEVVETVPMTFAITETNGAIQNSIADNYTKTITWQAKIRKGETKELSYYIDFPNTSPYFYLIGPIRLVDTRSGRSVFEEARSWQIASDALTTIVLNYVQTILTEGTTWTVPLEWNSAQNTIEVIGGGGAGFNDVTGVAGGGGGGGGAYSKITNLSLTGGQTVAYHIGSGGKLGDVNGGDTFFNRTSGTADTCADTSSVCAKGGSGGTTGAGAGAGGASSGGLPAAGGTRYSGGNGGAGTAAADSFGGGGGAGGPDRDGHVGGAGYTVGTGGGGGGGGGNGGNSAGDGASGNTGGVVGGVGDLGNGAGAAGGAGGSGGNGTTSGAGGGSGDTLLHGGNGYQGTNLSGGVGPGGGGGGGGGTSTTVGVGGNGGLYGGGGGGNRYGGRGAPGIIVITYDGNTATKTTFKVPTNWNNLNNTIEAIGAGGGARSAALGAGEGGGGGGGYSKAINVALVSGASVSYAIGLGGRKTAVGVTVSGVAGGNTYFCNETGANCTAITGSAVVVGANGGLGATGTTGAAGGSTTGAKPVGGTFLYAGGAGGNGHGTGDCGGGGGGAGGTAVTGGVGGNCGTSANYGGGGGGATGGHANAAGNNSTSAVGGSGGTGPGGSGAGGGGSGTFGGDATSLTGSGGGGGGDNGYSGGEGASGSASFYGGGGGGGGGDDNTTTGTTKVNFGGDGGFFGGGGGGALSPGFGANGGIIINYTPLEISGTCKQYDQTTNSTEAATIKISVNGGTPDTNTASCSGGSWTVTLAGTNPYDRDDVITIWVDNVDDANEAVAVIKTDGSNNISGVNLYERHLVIGSDDNTIASNSDLATYDNSVSGDEDIFFDVNGSNQLRGCIVAGCENMELYIGTGDKYSLGSASATFAEIHDIEIDGTFDMTGTGNYASISGSWNNDATFTPNTSTIFFTASNSAEIVSQSTDGTYAFNNVQFGDNTTTSYTGHWDFNGNVTAFDVNGNLAIEGGTMHGNKVTTLAGNLTIELHGDYLRDNYTFTFDGTTTPVTWTDSRAAPADMGMVSINGTTKRVALGSSVKANELTIAASQILDLGSSGYTLTISGDGQTTVRPFQNSGTLDCGTSSTVEYIASQSTDIEDTDYYNLKLASASTTFYITGSAATIVTSGSFNIDSGTFDGGDDEIQLRGTNASPFVVSGVFTPSTSTISYEGNTNINVASMSEGGNTGYYNLAVGDNTGLTAARTYALNGNASVSYDLTVGASGGSYTHILDGSSYNINLTGIKDPFVKRTYGSFTYSTSNVRYLGNGATSVNGSVEYYNLEIGESSFSVTITYTASTNIWVHNSVNLNSAAGGYDNSFSLGSYNLTVGDSSVSNSGTISVPVRSLISQTINGTILVQSSDGATTPTFGGAGVITTGHFTVGTASDNITYTFSLSGSLHIISRNFTISSGGTGTHTFSIPFGTFTVRGDFTVGSNASLSSGVSTIKLESTTYNTTYTNSGSSEPYNLTINKTGTDANDNVTLASNLLVRNTLTITDGQLIQNNAYDVRVEGSTAVSIASGTDKEWTNIGTGDLTLGGTFANAGSVSFDTNDSDCSDVTDSIQILSTSPGTQRTWSGTTGTWTMYNVYVQDMTRSDSPNITVYNGSSSNVTGNWTFGTCYTNPIVSQAHYRWRNDDNNESTATWKRAEDNLHSGQARSQNVRLRFSIKNTGAAATAYQFGLQVAPKNGGDCNSVASSSYTPVQPAGSCESDVACMADSTQFTSGDASTAQLTAEGTWVAGEMVDNSASISDAITVNQDYYTEAEFNFQFTSNASYGANYCFRLTNNGALLDAYTKLAEISVEGSSLINRLKGALRIKGKTRIK